MILLDTNAVIAVLDGKPARVGATAVERVQARERLGVSSIVVFELRFGIAKSQRRTTNAAKLDALLASTVEVLPFDDSDATFAGVLRQHLAAAGTPIGPYDVLIAGQALRHGATLVTANTREFARVPGLALEDWGKGG